MPECKYAFRSPVNGYLYCNYPGVKKKHGYNPYCVLMGSPVVEFYCPLTGKRAKRLEQIPLVGW